MLYEAKNKNIYKRLFNLDLNSNFYNVNFNYNAIVAAGIISPHHANPSCLEKCLNILCDSGLLIFSLNDHAVENKLKRQPPASYARRAPGPCACEPSEGRSSTAPVSTATYLVRYLSRPRASNCFCTAQCMPDASRAYDRAVENNLKLQPAASDARRALAPCACEPSEERSSTATVEMN